MEDTYLCIRMRTVVHNRINQLGMFRMCQRGLRFCKASGKQFQTEAAVQLVITSLHLRHLSYSVWYQASVQAPQNTDCRAWEERLAVKFSACLDRFDILNVVHIFREAHGSHFGHSISLCARATRAILNHAPIGEYRARYSPHETTACPCGQWDIETRLHILTECLRYKIVSLSPLRASATSSSSNLPSRHPGNPHKSTLDATCVPRGTKKITAPGSSWPTYVLLCEMHILYPPVPLPSIPP